MRLLSKIRSEKPYIFIVVLSLIAVLIAGMYFELISHAIDFNHTPVNVSSVPPITGIIDKNGTEATKMAEPLYPSMVTDPGYPGPSYLPPPATDQGMDLSPAYPLPAPWMQFRDAAKGILHFKNNIIT